MVRRSRYTAPPKYRVQKLVTVKGGSEIGAVWETIGGSNRTTVVERMLTRAATDNPDTLLRIHPPIPRVQYRGD